jgi:hypothetical protein
MDVVGGHIAARSGLPESETGQVLHIADCEWVACRPSEVEVESLVELKAVPIKAGSIILINEIPHYPTTDTDLPPRYSTHPLPSPSQWNATDRPRAHEPTKLTGRLEPLSVDELIFCCRLSRDDVEVPGS